MKLSVTQGNLSKALNVVSRVASGRNDLTILNNILLRTDGSRLLISATNLEVASTQSVGAKVDKPGSITVPARLVSEFISNLPSDIVNLEVKDSHLSIKSGKFSSVINGVVADEFPELPTVDETKAIKCSLPVDEFKNSVSQILMATSSDMTRAVLTGAFWHTHEGQLYIVATDGYRLAEKRIGKSTDNISAIIPASSLQEVMRSVGDDASELLIYFDETQVSFKTDSLEITSRLIDGKFPDYRKLIPASSETKITIKKINFNRIVKVASLFARESGGAITLSASKDSSLLSIHSIASELGENTSESEADISSDGQVTLNSRYLIEALSAIAGEEINFSFSGKLSPCVIQDSQKNTDYLHIIMPLKS